MPILFDKLILFLSSILLMCFLFPAFGVPCVLATLTAFSISCLCTYLNAPQKPRESDAKTWLLYGLLLCYLLLCLFFPAFLLFLPLLFYDMVSNRSKILCTITVLVLLICYQPVLDGELPHSQTGGFSLFLLLALTLLSFLLSFRTGQLLALQEEFKKLRDTSTEYSLLLSMKNKDLMEKQDYEIYLATLRERNRIAREIHDNVGHLLSRSLLQVGALQAISREPVLKQPLADLKDTLSGAMNSIRSSVHDLHDDSIDLQSAVTELLQDFKDYHIDFEYDMSKKVPRNVKYCLISILKEGLSNIARHSNGDRVHLVLREHPGIYQFLLEDNGSNAAVASGGIGLENMKERVLTLQGSFSIRTENGFRIFVTIPVEEGDL